MTALDAALAYAAKGIPVFPCNGKVPLTPNGFKDATTNPQQVSEWWRKNPNAWIGMPCGRASNLLVVDIDCHPGKASGFDHIPNWAELSDHIVKTAGGGRHLYFADDGVTAIAHPFPGVEVRGEGHYVILPGPYGYELERQGAIKPVPEFLLVNGRTSRGKTQSRRLREKPIPASLLKLCEGHWGKGISTDKDDLPDFELIVKAINLIENPDLPWGEWKRIIMAVWAAFLGNADGLAAAHAFSSKSDKYDAESTDRAWAEVTGSPPSDLSAGTLIYMADQAAPGWRDDPETDKPEPDTKAEEPSTEQLESDAKAKPKVSPIPLFWPGEEAAEEARWRVKGLMPEVGTGIVSARRGGGKTFVVMDMSYTLAELDTYIGKPITGNVGTLWIAKESPGQIPLRLRGLPDEPGTWPFRYIKTCPTILDGKGRANLRSVDDIIATVKVANDEMIERFGMPIGFVVIDTMRKAAGYGDRGENDPSQTGNVMQALSDIAEETRTFVLGIDHMGHDTSRGTRGGTSKEDDADLVIYLDGEHGKGTMVIEKVRDGIDSIAVEYECVVVELGLDRDGDPVTTCKVVLGAPGAAEPKAKSKKVPESTKLLLKAMGEIKEWPTPADNLRMAHKRIYKAEGKSPEHERNAWAKATKAYGLRFFDKDDLPMVDEPPM